MDINIKCSYEWLTYGIYKNNIQLCINELDSRIYGNSAYIDRGSGKKLLSFFKDYQNKNLVENE